MKACCNGFNRGMSEHLQDESVNKPLGMVHAMFVKARSAVCFSGIINLHVCPKKFNRGTSLITMIIKSVISKNMLNDLYIYNYVLIICNILENQFSDQKETVLKNPQNKTGQINLQTGQKNFTLYSTYCVWFMRKVYVYVIYWSQLDTKFEGSI